jgi:hypothetical protein
MKSTAFGIARATWIQLIAVCCHTFPVQSCGLTGEDDGNAGEEMEVNLLQALVQLQNTSDNVQVVPRVYKRDLRSSGQDNVCIDGRMVPELYVIGAQKAATTSLAVEVQEGKGTSQKHTPYDDEFFDDVKEHHVFDRPTRVAAGRDEWSSHYRPCQRYVRHVAVDATPAYLTVKDAPANIKNWYGFLANRIMFVVLLREPLARMHSSFHHTVRLGNLNGEPFSRNETFPQHVQQLVEDPHAQDESDFFQKSQYYTSLTNWVDTFDSHQFIVAPFLYQVARGSADPSVSSYVRSRLGLLPAQGDVAHENSYWHPDLDFELPPGSSLRNEIEDLFANTTGPHLLANLFAKQSADLYNYTESLTDEDSIALWLTDHWG